MSRGVRVAIAGTGFIGAVHARSARLAGATPRRGRAPHHPRARAAPRPRSGPSARSTPAQELVESPDVDVVHICTPNNLHVPLAEAALAAGKHVILREADRAGRRQRPGAHRRRRATRAGSPPCRSCTATTPRCARRASACAPGRDGPDPADPRHATCRTGCCARGRQLARRVGSRRRLARVRRHRLALVRPGRVRLRPSHHAPVRAHDDRRAGARQDRGARGLPGGQRQRRGPRGRDRGRGDRAVRDRPRRGRLDGHQPDLGRPQEPPLARARRRARRRWPSARRSPSRCGSGAARPRR